LRRARVDAPERGRSGLAQALIMAAAAIALVAALGGGILIGRTTASQEMAGGPTSEVPANAVQAKATDHGTGAVMAVTLNPKMGWVQLHADVSGIKAGLDCELRVVPKLGPPVLAGSWRVSKKGEADGTPLDGTALVDPSAVKSVEVVTRAGKTMVTVPIKA
jgi:hypothetical protein